MATKPDKFFKWTNGETEKVAEPDSSLQTTGYSPEESPTSKHFNYMFHVIMLWLAYLRDFTDDLQFAMTQGKGSDILGHIMDVPGNWSAKVDKVGDALEQLANRIKTIETQPSGEKSFVLDSDASASKAVFLYKNGKVRSDLVTTSEYYKSGTTFSEVASGDMAGNSVTIFDDWTAVGAVADSTNSITRHGSVYIFKMQSGQYVEKQIINATDKASYTDFGHAVKMNGDWLIVSSFKDSTNNLDNHGSVYVYKLESEAWTYKQKLEASDKAADDGFGWSIDIDDDWIAVAAWKKTVNGKTENGAVYMFKKESDMWSEKAIVTPSDGAISGRYGTDVSIQHPWLMVGAQVNQVYFVKNTDTNTWLEITKNTSTHKQDSDFFGLNVEIGESWAFASAHKRTGERFSEGAVIAYKLFDGRWYEHQLLVAKNKITHGYFGIEMSYSNEKLVIASTSGKDEGKERGRISYLTLVNDKWQEIIDVGVSNPADFDYLGRSMELKNETLIAGIPSRNSFYIINFSQGNYIGILKESGVATNSKPVTITGEVTGLTGLIPGKKVYTDVKGNITNNYSSNEIGVSLSSTEILLNR